MAYALITGAGSGIGRSIAVLLSRLGYDTILVARSRDALVGTAEMIHTKAVIVTADLSVRESCFKLYEKFKDRDIEIVVNNAGFGIFGEFAHTSLEHQLNMTDLNVCAVHTLTHLFLNKLMKNDRGYILNVASLAAFTPGPLMAGYYAGKAYVYKLTRAISRELKQSGSNVRVCAFCPGPVDTAFNSRAGVGFSVRPMSANKAARLALKGMFGGKDVVIPGFSGKAAALAMKVLPEKFIVDICYYIQKKKERNK